MRYALDEIRRSLAHHERQIIENLREITRKEEAIAMYNEKNIKHEQMVKELKEVIAKIED